MDSDTPLVVAAREEVKRQLRADGIDPDLPGWRGFVEIRTKELVKSGHTCTTSFRDLPMTPERFLARYEVQCFYHFTDTRNIDSIARAGGLFSLRELARQNINVAAPGGNNWSHEADERIGGNEYVHLCLFPEHPMEYLAKQEERILNSRFLQIDPKVLLIDEIRFTDDVSNKRGIDFLAFADACTQLDFEVIYDHTDWRDPEIQRRRHIAKRYELLVPTVIPLTLISGISNG